MRITRTYYLLFTILLGLVFTNGASAQMNIDCTPYDSWISPGRGLSGEVLATTEMNGELYVLHSMHTGSTSRIRDYGISKWNDATWSLVTSFQSSDPLWGRYAERNVTFKGYDGDLYLGGYFAGLNGDPELSVLVKWDGSSWLPARGRSDIENVSAMEIHHGELHAAMYIGQNGLGVHIMRLHDGNWIDVDDSFHPFSEDILVRAMKSWNGELHIGGVHPPSIGALPIARAFVWDGERWKRSVDSMAIYGISEFFIYDGDLYANRILLAEDDRADSKPLVVWKDGEWRPGLDPAGCLLFTVHNGQLHGIGMDWIYTPEYSYRTRIKRFNGATWETLPNTDGAADIMVSHNGKLFLGGKFSESCGISLSNIAMLYSHRNYGRISGTIYHDADGDCIRDTMEKGIPKRFIKISPGEQILTTNHEGRYSYFAEDGTYTVSLLRSGYWNQICPVPPQVLSVTVENGRSSLGNDIAMQPVPGIRDLRVSIIASPARQGRQLTYAVTYENAGTTTMSGTVRLLHDPILTFDSSQAATTRYVPGIAEWDFTDLNMGESHTIRVWTTVPVTTPMETIICSQAEITPKQQDTVKADNRDSVCVPVTAAYDPNDIRVTPFGLADDGIITTNDSVLTYWVRFQNTGNDTAFRVVVVDSLSAHLDIASIRLGASSHPFSFSIDTSNALVCTFNDIMLPDSNASEANSHGFFKFSARLKKGLPPGTRITNQVHIYFDYNAPVATNTVVSILGAPMSVGPEKNDNGLAIYPNPVRDILTIDAELRTGAAVTLRTLLGETVRSYRQGGTGPMTVDLGDLPAGVYLLTAGTADGLRSERVTVIK